MLKRSHAQAIANLTAKHLGLTVRPKVRFANVKRGQALPEHNIIVIPNSVRNSQSTSSTYLIAHEIVHCCDGGIFHGKRFRELEDKALKFWNISIKRKGAYPVDIRQS